MTENGESVVQAARLTKIFKDFWLREKVAAVADLDLDIASGEVFGLLGPNGSGKSTTLKMILGLLYPTRGRIRVFGKVATDVSVKARIGFLPEETYLYSFLDAHETLDFYGRLFHQPRRQRKRRIGMLLEMVGLSGVAYRRIGEYSKGMQRRIGLAQALINDPDLLILDEPTSGMDPIGTRQFKDLIRTLAQRGKTVIISSHLLADVEDVCDRVCILYGGRQRALGSTSELLSRKSYTQITTETLDEATLREIQRVLASAGKDLLEVVHPRERLESLFLRIVEEAREQRVATSGVQQEGRLAEFLRGEQAEGKELIERLVVGGESREEPDDSQVRAKEETPTQAKPAAKEVLRELVGPAPTGASSEPESRSPADGTRPKADKKLIEGLLGKGKDEPHPEEP